MKINLITQFYLDTNSDRNIENLKCLEFNLNNKYIDQIYMFLESFDVPSINHKKINLIRLGRRPTFHDLFSFSNELVNGNDIFVIANTDIYFDESINYTKKFLSKNDFFSLTRWDLTKDNNTVFFNKYHSQDSWIFKCQIDENIGDFFMGQAGCDNRLLYELKQAGIVLKNPSYSIKSVHVHMSQYRIYHNNPNYEFVEPPYDYILPNSFYSPLHTLFMKIFDQKKYEKFKFSLKDYFYIRYEYYRNKNKNELQRMRISYFERILAFAPRVYYYLLFQIFLKLETPK